MSKTQKEIDVSKLYDKSAFRLRNQMTQKSPNTSNDMQSN